MTAFNYHSVNHDARSKKHTRRGEVLAISEKINLCVNAKLDTCLAHSAGAGG